jgi:hypothetical protein
VPKAWKFFEVTHSSWSTLENLLGTPKYCFKGWGHFVSLFLNHLKTNSKGHHPLLLVERFPMTILLFKSKLWNKSYGSLNFLGLFPLNSTWIHATHIHPTWHFHVMTYHPYEDVTTDMVFVLALATSYNRPSIYWVQESRPFSYYITLKRTGLT